ncbi:hypothetical protein [Flavobacterium cerinum]|uniref:T9SS sorting signal type C domain-containing protein n=1 Tax=Flavobacterium cerinum TaxID=2502784 RepID=A0ABY5IS44_9FLAO|nr:hypothetical protein [Flavobacterium cerinum]UUC45676.1 hypothetical protein NOX80_00335 [Flavobacterium cerinum]
MSDHYTHTRKTFYCLKSIRTRCSTSFKSYTILFFKTLAIFFFCYQTGFSQVDRYTFSESSTTYSQINNGTNLFPIGWNNNSSSNIPIGFTFNFNGTDYTTCTVSSNGFISFGGMNLDTSNITNPISSNASYDGAISALGMDLMNVQEQSPIIYKTIGTAPNRTFIVQWVNIRRVSAVGSLNFQIRLEEFTNIIKLIYGPNAIWQFNNGGQVGLRGRNNTDFNNRAQIDINSPWANNTRKATTNSARLKVGAFSPPNNGLTYTWTPNIPSAMIVNQYEFSETTGQYVQIDTGTTNAFPSLPAWSNAASLNIPIGFPFNFNGQEYSNCTIVTNGFIAFGKTDANTGLITNPISSNQYYAGAISALGTNLRTIDATSTATYQTTGSAPNRTFIVQWKNVKSETQGGYYNFQIRLNESTNIIDIIYGSIAPTGDLINAQTGLRGFDNTDFNNRAKNSNSNWDNNTSKGTSNTATVSTGPDNIPSSGTIYSWRPIYKNWNGSDHNWNDPNNWLPVGVPTKINNVIIGATTDNNYPIIGGNNFRALAKTLSINRNGRLDIASGNSIDLVNTIYVQINSNFSIENNASIIQTDTISNRGKVAIKRTTQPMNRYDFTYWNSPVTLASRFTLGMLSPNTLADKYIKWLPTINNGNGNWISINSSTVMNPKIGYIVRAPQSFNLDPNNKLPYTATFTGTPNNGDISIPIIIGTESGSDDQWNLIGNPYPSAIDILAFINDAANSAILDGTIYLWTHNSPPSETAPNPFYGSFTYNFAASNYATINQLGATVTAISNPVPDRYIASGQSFFIKGLTNGNAIFRNDMRVAGNNDFFMKNSTTENSNLNQQPVSDEVIEKKRAWLNLTNRSDTFSQILIGYNNDATLDFDRGLDGQTFSGPGATLYSIIPNHNLTIQARPLPFNDDDQVQLGYTTETADDYEIGIDHLDAFFDNKTIYLEDKITNTIHNLKTAPYSFTSDSGTFDDRFVLRFNNTNLGHSTFSLENSIRVLNRNKLTVNSGIEKIKDITAYDLLGRKIDEYLNVNENEIVLKNVKKASGIVLLKIILENGTIVYRKTSF